MVRTLPYTYVNADIKGWIHIIWKWISTNSKQDLIYDHWWFRDSYIWWIPFFWQLNPTFPFPWVINLWTSILALPGAVRQRGSRLSTTPGTRTANSSTPSPCPRRTRIVSPSTRMSSPSPCLTRSRTTACTSAARRTVTEGDSVRRNSGYCVSIVKKKHAYCETLGGTCSIENNYRRWLGSITQDSIIKGFVWV